MKQSVVHCPIVRICNVNTKHTKQLQKTESSNIQYSILRNYMVRDCP